MLRLLALLAYLLQILLVIIHNFLSQDRQFNSPANVALAWLLAFPAVLLLASVIVQRREPGQVLRPMIVLLATIVAVVLLDAVISLLEFLLSWFIG